MKKEQLELQLEVGVKFPVLAIKMITQTHQAVRNISL